MSSAVVAFNATNKLMFILKGKWVRDMERVKLSDNVLSIELIVHFNMFDRMTIVCIVVAYKALRFFH